MSRDLQITSLRFVGSFDELAGLEYPAGTDQRDEVGWRKFHDNAVRSLPEERAAEIAARTA